MPHLTSQIDCLRARAPVHVHVCLGNPQLRSKPHDLGCGKQTLVLRSQIVWPRSLDRPQEGLFVWVHSVWILS